LEQTLTNSWDSERYNKNVYRKNDFAEVSKNLAKHWLQIWK